MWPQLQVSLQDVVSSGQVVIYGCNINKLFTTLTNLLSMEGIAQLGARVSGAAGFEVVDMINDWTNPDISSYKKSVSLGKVVSTILDYSIA